MRSRKRSIDATRRLSASLSDLPWSGSEPPAALIPGCSAGNRATRKGCENFSAGSALFQTLRKTQALAGFASFPAHRSNPVQCTGRKARPEGAGRTDKEPTT